MRKTLLEMVQSILSSLDGEEVNSIGDTVESLQVVGFIKNSYEEIIDSLHLPVNKTLFELTPSDDLNKPVLMYLPDYIQNIEWLKYDKTDDLNNLGYQDVEYQELQSFLDTMYSDNDLTADNTKTFNIVLDTGTFPVYYRNDRMPSRYTTFDDKTLIFDSYDANMSSTLVGNKTVGFGERVERFLSQDNYIPNLPANLFALLENEAKAQAFVEQKQTQNPTAEKRARKGWVRTQNDKTAIPYTQAKLRSNTDYGRHGFWNSRPRFLRDGN